MDSNQADDKPKLWYTYILFLRKKNSNSKDPLIPTKENGSKDICETTSDGQSLNRLNINKSFGIADFSEMHSLALR